MVKGGKTKPSSCRKWANSCWSSFSSPVYKIMRKRLRQLSSTYFRLHRGPTNLPVLQLGSSLLLHPAGVSSRSESHESRSWWGVRARRFTFITHHGKWEGNRSRSHSELNSHKYRQFYLTRAHTLMKESNRTLIQLAEAQHVLEIIIHNPQTYNHINLLKKHVNSFWAWWCF